MNKCMMLVAGCLLSLALVDRANAQMFVTYQSPVVPVSTFWAPAPVVYTSYFARRRWLASNQLQLPAHAIGLFWVARSLEFAPHGAR